MSTDIKKVSSLVKPFKKLIFGESDLEGGTLNYVKIFILKLFTNIKKISTQA